MISQKPTPTLHHSILQKRLVSAIYGTGSDYETFPELRCVLITHSVVPDITILHRIGVASSLENRQPIGNQPVIGAPNWLIESFPPTKAPPN